MSKLLKRLYHIATLDLLFPFQYARYRKRPLQEDKAVFLEANLPELSSSLRYLYDRIGRETSMERKVHCLREAFSGKIGYIRRAMNCLKDMATARYIFLCEGSRLVSCIVPRKETCIVQVWHGCGAFKKFGFSTSDLLFGGDRRENERYSYYKNYDLVTVSSPEVVWAYQEAMNLPKNDQTVLPLGISRTDVFFKEEFRQEARERVCKAIPKAGRKKTILYAPTFRGSVGGAKAPDRLDMVSMKKALGEEYVLLVKQHPIVKKRPPIPVEAGDFAFDVSETCTIEDLICVCDICISDYSSLVYEYSLMDRPMIFFAYDLEEYGDWRGFYYEYEELTPGPVVRTTKEVISWIREEKFDMEQVRAFRERFMSACDGHATERLLKAIGISERAGKAECAKG